MDTTKNKDGVFTLASKIGRRVFEVRGTRAFVTYYGPDGRTTAPTLEVTREAARTMYAKSRAAGFEVAPALFCPVLDCNNELCEAEIAESRKAFPKRPPMCAGCLCDEIADAEERRWAESDV